MKIFLAIKYHADHGNQDLVEVLTKHLHQQGHQVVCAAKDFELWGRASFNPKELLLKAFEAIQESDLVLIEATEKGVGVGIEAGYAFAHQIPVMTVAKKDSELSINLKSISFAVQIYNEVSEIKIPKIKY